ncbi:hypothetical protein [Streptomyces sp. NPDC046985]|uniref:hypothetical protein n=1 Tax=Streptomyces sp. NPDC046985 TaxID=3155377 RepID=UPI00340FE4C0
MAVAIHIRGFLTYRFPLVIDGFIAHGIRAFLVLRNAPLAPGSTSGRSSGTATAASIWANALHAVRINQDAVAGTGLRLGDAVVAVLSTITRSHWPERSTSTFSSPGGRSRTLTGRISVSPVTSVRPIETTPSRSPEPTEPVSSGQRSVRSSPVSRSPL